MWYVQMKGLSNVLTPVPFFEINNFLNLLVIIIIQLWFSVVETVV